ncbi:MAG TPA: MCE family protein [Pseudonocardia sp.]|jgi:virulence factor Mce-like protein
MADRLATGPRRLLGLGMVGIVVAVLGTCVAVYNKAFTDQVPVTVHIAQVDNSFLPKAEVRMKGVAVGEVAGIDSTGDVAVLHLDLIPEQAARIPRNVRAMILPKSLFGESFLSLESVDAPSPDHIVAGDDIPRDRSGKAVQVEQLFAHLLPLIQAVKPADLANALGALSQSLTGRGAQLGDTVTQLHQYLAKFNPTLPDLTDDIKALPELSDTYSKAAPDLIEGLKDLDTTSDTLVEREDDIADLFDTVTTAADDLRDFTDRNGDKLIKLADTAKPTLRLLERYSPEYVCLINRLAAAVPLGKAAFGEGTARPALRVNVVVTATRGPFLPHLDEPEITDGRGPACYDDTPPIEQYPGGPAEDGSTHPPAATPGGGIPHLPPLGQLPLAAAKLPLVGGAGSGVKANGPAVLLRGAEGRGR